ncbi:hypothetical protein [Polaromonas sp.]|uniref:hypothetical protein n=1 Tax=Polaromonas sp. TaxID=1869339 RepID=UPI00326518E2
MLPNCRLSLSISFIATRQFVPAPLVCLALLLDDLVTPMRVGKAFNAVQAVAVGLREAEAEPSW